MSDDRRCWSNVKSSSLGTKSINPIRQLVDCMDLQPNPDKQMIALSIGDPTIFGNLRPPEIIAEALAESLASNRNNGYAASTGKEEAKVAVARYSSYDNLVVKPKDVIMCSGCSCALDMCISVIAERGQNILIPRPGFSIYETLANGLGIESRHYKLLADQEWEVDLEDLERKIDNQTAAIIVNNPSNPCGSVYSKEHLLEILDIASRHCVPIIADEIYEHIVFEGEQFVPIASLSVDVPILTCSGIGKRFLVPGWRMGWVIVHDKNGILKKSVCDGLQSYSQRSMGASSLIQGALPTILSKTTDKFFYQTLSILEGNAVLLYNSLKKIKGLKPNMPRGAMYMMVRIDLDKFPEFESAMEFVTTLVSEESCFCLPGNCFGVNNYIRITITPPEEMLIEACLRINDFCKRHYKNTNICESQHNIFINS